MLYIESDDPKAVFDAAGEFFNSRREQPEQVDRLPVAAQSPASLAVDNQPAAEVSIDPAPSSAKPKRKYARRAKAATATAAPSSAKQAKALTPTGGTSRERAVAYLKKIGRPEKKSVVAKACGIPLPSAAWTFSKPEFTSPARGLVDLADRSEPWAGDDDPEDGCTSEASAHPPPDNLHEETHSPQPDPPQDVEATLAETGGNDAADYVEPDDADDEPFADDPPFDPLAASSPMRLPAPTAPPPVRRKPGRPPKSAGKPAEQFVSPITEIAATSTAVDHAAAAVRAELAVADRPLSLAKLAGLTRFNHAVLAQALNDPAFECEGGKYRLKEN
jgi:hypothetical protein